jgi:ABC-type oligopeptide transport system ATPase subunit
VVDTAIYSIGNQSLYQNTDSVKVHNLVKYLPIRGGVLKRIITWVQAVDDVSFTIREGEKLGLVGES